VGEFAGFIAARIARRLRAAHEAALVQQRSAAAATRGTVRGTGAAATRAQPAVPPAKPPTMPALGRSAAPRAPRVRTEAADPFPTLLATPGSAPVRVAPSALLAAFAGGNALLGALVLAEALAPPLALRDESPQRR